MGSVRLAIILSIALMGLDQGDRLTSPITNADEIAGPWETAAGAGIEGIYINVDTAATQTDSGSAQTPPWQTFQVNVYRRRAGETTNGWFAAEYKSATERSDPAPTNSTLSFANDHLRIVFASGTDMAPLNLDLTFDPGKKNWTGTMEISGESTTVALSRPQATQGASVNAIVGDWKGGSKATEHWHGADTTICIRQSADGLLTAWMNRDLANRAMLPNGTISRVGDVRSGELLDFTSFEKGELHLKLGGPGGGPYEFVGELLPDSNHITGTWQGGGGTLNAQQDFHRVAQ
jgi:hypothetical protein